MIFMKMDKLNKLSNDELKQVSGGCDYETCDDSKFLNVLLRGTDYHRCDRYGKFKIFWGSSKRYGPCEDIENSWRVLGIEMVPYAVDHNEYWLNGKLITRDEAWDYAEKLVGKHLERKDWDW